MPDWVKCHHSVQTLATNVTGNIGIFLLRLLSYLSRLPPHFYPESQHPSLCHSFFPLPLSLQTMEHCAYGRTLPTKRTRRWWRRGRASPTCCPPPEVSPPPAFTVKINALFYYVPSSHPPFVLTAKIIPAVPRWLPHSSLHPSHASTHTTLTARTGVPNIFSILSVFSEPSSFQTSNL